MIIKSRAYQPLEERTVLKFAWWPVRVSDEELLWLGWYLRMEYWIPYDDNNNGEWRPLGNKLRPETK